MGKLKEKGNLNYKEYLELMKAMHYLHQDTLSAELFECISVAGIVTISNLK